MEQLGDSPQIQGSSVRTNQTTQTLIQNKKKKKLKKPSYLLLELTALVQGIFKEVYICS